MRNDDDYGAVPPPTGPVRRDPTLGLGNGQHSDRTAHVRRVQQARERGYRIGRRFGAFAAGLAWAALWAVFMIGVGAFARLTVWLLVYGWRFLG